MAEIAPPPPMQASNNPAPPPTAGGEKGPTEQINALNSRIRMFEETLSEFRKRIIFIEQNIVAYHKKAIGDIKTLSNELLDEKKTIVMLEDRILTLIKEIKLLAKKEDVEVIKKYVELLNPMKYVTAERVEQLLKEMLEEQGQTPTKETEHEHETNQKTELPELEETSEEKLHKKKKLNPEDIFKI